MNTFYRILIFLVCMMAVRRVQAQAQAPVVTITATPVFPISPILNQLLSQTGRGIRVMMVSTRSVDIALIGRLEKLSPQPAFTMRIPDDFRPGQPIRLTPQIPVQLTNNILQQAYGNFDVNSIQFSGISLDALKDGLNYKLPEGNYRMCFRARDYKDAQAMLSPEICVSFTICYQAAAPQFTQPVNNFGVTESLTKIIPRSPVVFTWTPPRAMCGSLANAAGSLQYELEIREMFENQTVTDAINNPYVFRKALLPSTTFLLDTNLYKNVLQQGRRYIMRVRASVNRNSPVQIDNSGYSRVEAFQYGERSISLTTIPPSELYYIPFRDRKTDFWDDMMTAYEKKERTDTLVPIKEYIPMVLARNGLVYSYDAIELFLALNTDLYSSPGAKLSYSPKLPELPEVAPVKRTAFTNEHARNLLPDPAEGTSYTKNLDSITAIVQRGGSRETPASTLNGLLGQLNTFRAKVSTTSRVTMRVINDLLSELTFRLSSEHGSSLNQSQLQELASGITELISGSESTSSLFRVPSKQTFARSSLAGHDNRTRPEYLPFAMDPLLSFDIVVYHLSKDQPPKPLVNTGDLTATYKVFYTQSQVYNPKNPEINAKATAGPASTAQVSLPKTKFKFWTQSMFTNKLSKAQDVDLLDAFLNSRKRWPQPKNYTIVLKVD